jgi:PAS domain-containing protein/GGDEF domain-containing protein
LFRKQPFNQPTLRRLTLLLIFTLVYGVLFAPLKSFWGNGVTFLVLLPVGFAGWAFGIWIGMGWGVICWLFNGMLWWFNSSLLWDLDFFRWAIISLVLYILTGFIIGHIHDQRARRLAVDEDQLARLKLVNAAQGGFETAIGSLIDFIPDAALAVNREGRLVAWNNSLEVLTGAKVENVLGREGRAATHYLYGDDRPLLVDFVLKSGESPWSISKNMSSNPVEKFYPGVRWDGGALVVENFIPRLKAGGIYLWTKASPLFNLDGELIGAMQVMRDVTNERLIEEKNISVAQRDDLTGLYTQAYFIHELKRHDVPALNDQQGLSAFYPISIILIKMTPLPEAKPGVEDDLLKCAVLGVLETSRANDLMARIAEYELGVVLPRTDVNMVQHVAERLRKVLAQTFSNQQDINPVFTLVSVTAQEPGSLVDAFQQGEMLFKE